MNAAHLARTRFYTTKTQSAHRTVMYITAKKP